MAFTVYVLRLTGFLIAGIFMPPALERALGLLPVVALTALITAKIVSVSDDRTIRLTALVVAGVAARYSGRAWVCITVGMLVLGLIRLLVNQTG